MNIRFAPNTLYYGDCLDILADFPNTYIDLICLDPSSIPTQSIPLKSALCMRKIAWHVLSRNFRRYNDRSHFVTDFRNSVHNLHTNNHREVDRQG